MTPERMDMELFGEEGGGGPPAQDRRFERAHGGTLYLDEVADMPRETQSRILRVLVEQRFRRVGGDQTCRWTCGWSRPPPRTSQEIAEGASGGPVPSAERGAGAGVRG
jgi:hypothetical protein